MTYKHLTIDELTMIESYYLQHNKPVEIANRMGRAIQTIYNVVNKFKQGKTALDYWHQYKENKKKCEFLVNAICPSGCTNRKKHYELNSISYLNYNKPYRISSCAI